MVYHYREDGWTSCDTGPGDSDGTAVWYYNDTTGGQSGAPFVSFFGGTDYRVRAVHSGYYSRGFANTNGGRRIKSDLVEFIRAFGGF
jgi:hypothetical protein